VWLDLKEDVTGYYLMLLPADIMNRALNSGKLSDMEIQDVFNGWRFGWQAGKVNPVDILKLAYHFRNTANSAVINGLAGRIQDIKTFLSSTLPADLFIQYMDRTTAPMLEKLGLKVSLSLTGTEVLTQSTLISTLDHNPEIIKKVSELGREYLENQVLTNNHFIYLRTLFYNYGDDQLYESVLNKIKNTKIPSERNILIYALGYFPEKFIQKNLQLALTGDLEPNMRTWIPLYMNNMYRLERQNTGRRLQPNLLEWYKKHEDFYKETVSEAVLNHFLPKLVIDKADVDTFNRLFPEEKRAKTLQLELNKRISEIERKIKLNDLYAGKVKKYLQNFNDHIQ
jgi:hypothetical protein